MTTESLDAIPADWPHRSSSRFVSLSDIRWHIQVFGQGPTVVLLHGTGASTHSWAEVIPFLVPRCRVVVPDLPGHGFTRGATRLSLTEISTGLDSLMTALGIEQIDLVAGHSAGAAVALRWALSDHAPPRAVLGFNPSLVPPPGMYTRLVAPIITPLATSRLASVALASLGARTSMIDGLLDSTGSKVSPAQRALYKRLFADPEHVRGSMGFMAAADLDTLLQQVGQLSMPIKMIVGSQDPWVQPKALQAVLARSLPMADVALWSGGHLLHESQPERAAQAIAGMIEAVDAAQQMSAIENAG